MNELKPWYAVATPHKDIREGRLNEAVFAANIWAVVQEDAPDVYLDPEEFYRKTYMTSGLKTVLKRVAAGLQLEGESGDRIISLQTAFGGGKTHILVALWHLAKHADVLKRSPYGTELREVLGERFPEEPCNVAVFTNQTCDATQGRITPEGVHTRTLWGELAVQLGGKELYEKVRANDEARRVPQGLFIEVLRAASPCLILLDELADYCVGAAAVPVGETTLADQTISFVQQLTEAVQQVPGAMVVATLPASRYEVTQSEKGQEIFTTLERRFQRLGADIKPVADDEIYDVVRARLFESITPPELPDYPQQVAKAYQEMYASHVGEVPTAATKRDYRERIARAYPFHPLLIDALYTRWGSHRDFQRTRGVLRLLASVVGDLWGRRNGNTQTQHLIQPSHLRWSIDALQAQLTRLWGIAYQSVAAADVIGDRSNAGVFDLERGGDYLREGIARGLAAAILLGSFGGQGERAGFSTKELKLAGSRYGVNWGYLDGAIMELENRCFYLHSALAGSLGKRYWFGTKPTLNKLVVQYRHQIANEDFAEEILEDLQEVKNRSADEATWRVLVNPGVDLPEQKSLALLILPPSLAWDDNGGDNTAVRERVLEISRRCGRGDRLYRNTLVFLAGTSRGLSRLRKAYRERAALEAVRADYWEQLDDEQKRDLKERLEKAAAATEEALGTAYTVALRVSGSSVEACVLPDARRTFSQHLAYLWHTLVEDEEWILRRVGLLTLEETGLVPKEGGIRLKDAIEAFLRFTDKPMIASKQAVIDGLTQACADGIIGIGRGASLSTLQKRYCNERIALDPTEEGVWIIPPFTPEPAPEVVTSGEIQSGSSPGTEVAPGPARPGTTTKRTVKRIVIRGAVPIENYTELFRCFVSPAARMNLKNLHLGIDFEMEPAEDQSLDPEDATLKTMKEAARQLGLDFKVE